MVYGQCETYGVKGFDFFKTIKNITLHKKGWIEVYNNVDLDVDSHEEED